jgi:tRNA-dihydrouridine synthase A
MLDWTTHPYRYFARQITRYTWLYTEMVTTGALIHGNIEQHLRFDPSEQPIALQLGGSDTASLAACVQLAKQWGYNEVNLNVGCPSERVQNGAFGACLMAEPHLVADCVKAMLDAAAGDLAITVKHRIGIDAMEGYDPMRDFVGTLADAGCQTFIVHARKALLKGLSPKENRTVPPLQYDLVYRLKAERPDLEVILNGGVKTQADIDTHLLHVDGVMVGREAYHHPWLMADWDSRYFGAVPSQKTRAEIVEAMRLFTRAYCASGGHLRDVTRGMLGLFSGQQGARVWRQMLSDAHLLKTANDHLLYEAMAYAVKSSDRIQP